jgi:methyl-accepting chemotaxis protein
LATVKAMKVTRHPMFVPEGAAAAIPADADLMARLESSFRMLSRPESGFADRVYERLFKACPHLRSLFPADMTRQKEKLVATLRDVIDHLRDPAANRARLLDLGRAHVGFGAKPEHYPIVTVIMVSAMADATGAAWTKELAAEWTRAMQMVASVMIEGASTEPPTS